MQGNGLEDGIQVSSQRLRFQEEVEGAKVMNFLLKINFMKFMIWVNLGFVIYSLFC